jgi:hypothetical protein
MPRFAWSHHCRARATPAGRSSPVHRQSSGTHHKTRLLKQKGKCVFVKRIKGRPAQNLQRRWWVVIAVGPPLRHLWHRNDITVFDIVVVERARHDEYRRLLAGLPNEVRPGLISEVVQLTVVPPDVCLMLLSIYSGIIWSDVFSTAGSTLGSVLLLMLA